MLRGDTLSATLIDIRDMVGPAGMFTDEVTKQLAERVASYFDLTPEVINHVSKSDEALKGLLISLGMWWADEHEVHAQAVVNYAATLATLVGH